MKKILVLAVLAMFSIASFAQNGVKWETTSLKEVLNKAKNNKKGPKIVFMDCYTTWCGPCKHMANVVFPTKEAGDYFNKNFVNFKCDMEKGEGLELAKKYNIKAYPTFLILDGDGNEIGRILGSVELKDFRERVEKAKDPANNIKNILKQYKETNKSEYAYNYLERLNDLYMQDEIINFFNDNIESIDKYEKCSAKMWIYISNAISLEKQNLLNDILANKYRYDLYIGKGSVDKALLSAYKNGLFSYLSGKTTLSEETVNRVCDGMTYLISDNYYENLLISASRAYLKRDFEALKKLFKAGAMYSCTPREAGNIIKIYTSLKEISDPDKAQFLKDYRTILEKMMKDTDNQMNEYKSAESTK